MTRTVIIIKINILFSYLLTSLVLVSNVYLFVKRKFSFRVCVCNTDIYTALRVCRGKVGRGTVGACQG